MQWTTSQPFQSLALAGGGYRGLFTARVLEHVEEYSGSPIARHFDLVCGTSIGGLIALAAAFEVPMRQVAKVFVEEGENIFPPHRPPVSTFDKGVDQFTHWRKPRYDPAVLRAAIGKLIDPQATLADALHPVAIPAVNVTQGRPQVFKTHHHPEWSRDWHYKVMDVAMATAAAPTFYELAEVDGSLYTDGGLFANAPDLVAVHEAEHFFGVPVECQRLVSIGTTTRNYAISFSAGREFGAGDWMDENRLFCILIAAQQQFVEAIARHRLGPRYLRIDEDPSQELARDLGLDTATAVARQTLLGLGSKAAEQAIAGELPVFLQHQPQLAVIGKEPMQTAQGEVR